MAGEFGRYQLVNTAILSVSYLCSAFLILGYVFWAAMPDHWCHVHQLDHLTNWTLEEKKMVSIPLEERAGDLVYSRCSMYDRNYSQVALQRESLLHGNGSLQNLTRVTCTGWTYDTSTYSSSIVTQVCWELLYNWLIWRVIKLAFFFKKVFSLYLFWRLEQSEQRHFYLDIFLCDL